MTIFVTGMSGFIGGHLQKKLGNLNQTKINQTRSNPNEMAPGDIYRAGGELIFQESDRTYYSQVTTLLHLGSFTPKTSSESNTVGDAIDSLTVTQQLCSGVFPNLRKILFASSMDVYKRCNSVIDESSELDIRNLYIASKVMSEHTVLNYCKDNDIAFDILRIGHVYGRGDSVYQKVLPKMIKSLYSGETFMLNNNAEQLINLLYIHDLIDVIIQLIGNSESLGILNVVSSNNVKIKSVIEILEKITELKLRVDFLSENNDAFQYKFSNEKLKKALVFHETPMEEAIKIIIDGNS